MPRVQKQRRLKRKRYNKRRSRKSYHPKVNAVSVSKALNASKKYIWESRKETITTSTNRIKYGILPCVLNYNAGAISDSPTLNTIVAQAGHEASAWVGTDTNYKVRVSNQKVIFKLRNLSNHPCFITLGNYIAKDEFATGTGPGNAIMQHLVSGWDTHMESAQVNSIGTGTVVQYTSPGDTCETSASTLHPSHSYQFGKSFKLLKRAVYKMKPGDDIYWALSAPYCDVENRDQISRQVIKNKTSFCMYRVHGALGKQNTDDTIVGYTQVDIGMEILMKAKVYRIQNVERSIPFATPYLDTIAAALEGPTDHEMKDHNL